MMHEGDSGNAVVWVTYNDNMHFLGCDEKD